jgi:uncharacterized membrane protein YciS (DUF1049 family)
MKGYFLKVWLWIKALVLAAVILYLILFVANNNEKSMKVWLWIGREPDVSLLGLISTLLATGVVLTLLIKTVITTIRQIQEARAKSRTLRLEKEVAEMRAKAEMLQKRDAASSSTASTPPPSATSTDTSSF